MEAQDIPLSGNQQYPKWNRSRDSQPLQLHRLDEGDTEVERHPLKVEVVHRSSASLLGMLGSEGKLESVRIPQKSLPTTRSTS